MRQISLEYLEVLNTTEQVMVFITKFNRKDYGTAVVVNTALNVKQQDEAIAAAVMRLVNINRENAKEAEEV